MDIIRKDWKERFHNNYIKHWNSPKRWAIRILVIIIGGALGYAHYSATHPSAEVAAAQAADSAAMARAMDDTHTTPPPASTPTAQPTQGVVPISPEEKGAAVVHVADDAPASPTQRTPTLTSDTYGNQVASFFPGEAPDAALMDALGKVNSSLSVDGVDTLGYPLYQLECEANSQCFNGTGTAFGSTADNAKQMFPINPADIQQHGLKCNVICYNAEGRIIGRDPNFHG